MPQPTVQLTGEEFLARYGAMVYRVAQSMHLGRADAEDVLGRTGEIALVKAAPADENQQFRWVYGIAWRVCRNLRRKHRPTPVDPSGLDAAADDDQPAPLDDLIRAEQLQALQDALATLSPRDRRIIEHLFLAESPLSYAELADLLGVKPDSIGPYRVRALDRLRKQLRRRGF